MPIHPFRHRVERLLGEADVRVVVDAPTVPIDPARAPADSRCDPCVMQVHDERLYARLIEQGSLGLGESYMDGWWDTPCLDGLLFHLLDARLDKRVPGIAARLDGLRSRLLNLQSRHRAFVVGERHYDLGNDLYQAMLGRRLVYSCGYWRAADNLDDAQEAKLDLVCRKLGLQAGMRVLDIGCGWGEALKFAAQRYGVSGVGITVSQEQAEYARELCAGLPIEIRVQDYRELDEPFDRGFSLGMFEHVGVKNYRRYFEVARRCLREDHSTGGGLFLLHTIGSNVSVRRTDPWIARYIFPNSMLPSAAQLARACEGLFVIEDWHGFGPDYDRTLQAWRDNIERAWPSLPARYDERFRRMWRYYLAASMATFRSRRSQLWQCVLSPRGMPGGYAAQR
ncbi:cyclopropane fatty acyl phospholipid synthase [Lysobacter koreensis]|uniref:Cyclopropane fatty acyl phospholipid synthase n=1 Tax=Lysobacter koreensis TaxID=266122 RepID=A0ABW2YLM6_9GAMM